ncbi:unnamed protein product [Spirodela intermedia]|uniref:Uncharacterized protein n=1 Tax=Spirodela intermedia TaxID=51605 RepID=A0A7I8J605_SPIIN|nr:unnamed protein product [Spirodela intermedia]CAA6664872.1 unnamed protein product [Spirodela intermedia]
MVGAAICKAIPLHAQGVLIIQDFLPLELSGTYVILGIQWLRTLRWILTNYKKFIMRFMMGGKIHIFKGDLIFTILSKNSLHINVKKCRFGESKPKHLGH